MESEGACFVRELDKMLDEQVDQFVSQENDTIMESANTTAIPLDDDEQRDVGERVLEFCGDLPVYLMIFDDDEAAAALRDDSSSEVGDENSGRGSGGDKSSSGSRNNSRNDESGGGSDGDSALHPTKRFKRRHRHRGVPSSPPSICDLQEMLHFHHIQVPHHHRHRPHRDELPLVLLLSRPVTSLLAA